MPAEGIPDHRLRSSRLESGGNLTLDSGGEIAFEAVKDLHQESHEKSKSSFVWNSMSGKGNTDETVLQSQLIAKGSMVVQAVNGLKIDLKEVNQQSVRQTIDAMVKADPGLIWLKEMEQRGDVDWRRVKEVHDSFKYSHSGLGGGAAMIIAIVVTYLTWGAGSGLVGAAQGTWQAAAANTVVSSVASKAAVSTINNRGNLNAVIKDVTSKEAVRDYAVGGLTAGLTAGLFDGILQTKTDPLTGKVTVDLSSLEGVGRFAGNQVLQNGTSTILDRALGGKGSLSDVLRSSFANTFAAAGFNWVGDKTAPEMWDIEDGSLAKIGLHAVMGGLAAEAAGGSFRAGALAAGVNEALVDRLSDWYGQMESEQKKSLLVMNSQVIGILVAAGQGGSEEDLKVGSWVSQNSTQYNYTAHWSEFEKQHEACNKNPSDAGCATVLKVAGVTSESLGNVALNKGGDGSIVSYTLLDSSGHPWMIMEPSEYKVYIASPRYIQEGYKTAPQWQLNMASVLLYTNQGDVEKAADNYAFMLRDPGYRQEMLLNLALGVIGGGPSKGILGKLDELLPNTKTRVLTETEARALGGDHKGLIYVAESPRGKPAAQAFQAGTSGAFTDLASGKLGVPALRYVNPNEKGVNFIKFDGVEKGVDGSHILLIDAKTKLAIWGAETQKAVMDTLRRVKSALDQNPGYKVVYEFPNKKIEAQAKAFIRANGFGDVVSTRTRIP